MLCIDKGPQYIFIDNISGLLFKILCDPQMQSHYSSLCLSDSAASHPPLIMQSPPPYSSPQDSLPDLLLNSPDHKQKRGKVAQGERRQADKAATYDFMTSEDKLPFNAGKAGQGLMPGEPVQEKGGCYCV